MGSIPGRGTKSRIAKEKKKCHVTKPNMVIHFTANLVEVIPRSDSTVQTSDPRCGKLQFSEMATWCRCWKRIQCFSQFGLPETTLLNFFSWRRELFWLSHNRVMVFSPPRIAKIKRSLVDISSAYYFFGLPSLSWPPPPGVFYRWVELVTVLANGLWLDVKCVSLPGQGL